MVKTLKALFTIVLSAIIVLTSVVCGFATSDELVYNDEGYIDNSSLVTPWVPDDQVMLDENNWPTWVNDLVIAEARIERMSEGGTIKKEDVEPMLKHLAEVGVNGLWVTPIEDKGLDTISSTYCNMGLHTIDPYLTGQLQKGEPYSNFGATEADYDEGRRRVKEFVDLCHDYNIRIFFDKVPWGVSKVAPIYFENEDWFKGASTWGGMDFKLDHPGVIDYYYTENRDFIIETGCDGIRWDLEPSYFGYELYEDMHAELNSMGIKTLFFSEDQSFHGGKAYAFAQYGDATGRGASSQFSYDYYFNDIDIVEAVKTGKNIGHSMLRGTGESGQYRHYTYQISSHDCLYYHDATPAAWGYQFLYGSFIPLWYVGEEWNSNLAQGSCYSTPIANFAEQIDATKESRAYYEEVKELIAYRWIYKDIINASTENHRDTNICTAKVKGTTLVQGYARYKDNKGFIVVPNVNENTDKPVEMTVAVPLEHMGLNNYTKYTLTNVRTGKVMVQGDASKVTSFTDTIDHNNVGLYYLVAEGKIAKPEDNKNNYEPVDTVEPDDDNGNDLDTDDELNDGDGEKEVIKKLIKKRKKVVRNSGFPVWAIIAIAGGIVVLGGVATVIIIKKRRKI